MAETPMPKDSNVPLVVLVGATASGKSELAIRLALRLGGEVVNGDSMQVYRGMDIGTAKVPFDERRGVPHHLLDLLDVTQPATVAEFQAQARTAIAECRRRSVTPILVGGSALYVRAVVDDFDFPGSDDRVRADIERDLAVCGAVAMHARLRSVDPVAAETIEPSNGRRIVRALEVNAITGRPFAATLPAHRSVLDPVVLLGLDLPRDVLDDRIAARVDRMWAAGFVDEVRRLDGQGLRGSRTASRALGYQQVLAALDPSAPEGAAREAALDAARLETIARTRRFARRQDSWFRKDPRICWLPFDAPDLLDRALVAIDEAAVRSTL